MGYLHSLQKKKAIVSLALPFLSLSKITKSYYLLPLFYLWHTRKQMLLITKLFTITLLYVFINFYEPDHYDIRPLLLCLLLVAGSHAAIIFQLRTFEQEFLLFTRNLPIRIFKLFFGHIIIFLLLLMPELLFICRGAGIHFGWHDYPQLVLFSIAIMALFYVVLLLDDHNMDTFVRLVFMIMAVVFFLVMYSAGIAFWLFILVLSFAFFQTYYFTFEKKVEILE